MTKAFIAIREKGGGGTKPLTQDDLKSGEAKRLNELGYGIFGTVNEFEATDEQLRAKGVKTIRNDEFCTKINAVYADLDVAKSGDGTEENDREVAKNSLKLDLMFHCEPNKIIITKNGLQPLWYLKDGDPKNKERAKNIINGIIEWSKLHGSAGDAVKDISRVLRVPGFYHMKSEPYMVEVENGRAEHYDFEELEKAFPFEVKPQAPQDFPKAHNNKTDEIDRIEFTGLVIKAFSSVSRRAEFDKQKRLILDGRLTGTHLGKINGGDFLASNSHEPFVGNRITVVANILQVTNSEAYKWICDEYQIEFKQEEKKKIRPAFKDENSSKWFKTARQISEEIKNNKNLVSRKDVISTGFKDVDSYMGGIFPTSLIVIGGRTGHGKSELCKNIAMDAAMNGKKVLMFDFENDKGEMLAREIKSSLTSRGKRVKKTDIKTKEFWEKHGEMANDALEGLNDYFGDNLLFYSSDEIPTIDEFLAILDSVEDVDLIIIDHLHYFSMEAAENQAQHIGEIMRKVRVFTKVKRIPVIIASHVRNPSRERPPVESDLFGSSNIAKEAECVIFPYRMPEAEGEINTKIIIAKNRAEGRLKTFKASYSHVTSKITIQRDEF